MKQRVSPAPALFAAGALCAALLLAASPAARAQMTDSQVEARKLAFEVANAFANDGFKLRDGFFPGRLEPGGSEVLTVHLYAGNAYWFSAAADRAESRIEVRVFDELGNDITSDTFSQPGKSAAGAVPEASGLHYVRVRLADGPGCDFALLYSYK